MWQRIKLILSNRTIMMRILFTLAILLVFRFVSYITIPLINVSQAQGLFKNSGFLEILNNYSGQALQRYSILALGISPYITASIVIQLIQMVVPAVKEISEQGEVGKQKLNRITRYVAIALAFIQGLLLIIGGNSMDALFLPEISDRLNMFHYIYPALIITAGSAFAIWVGDLITKKGIGNGTSMLIVVGIVTSIPTMVSTVWGKYITNGKGGWDIVWLIVIFLLYVVILLGVVYMQLATRKVPIQYANRQGKTDSNVPIKLNSAGVMPVIFASTILSIPLTIIGFFNSGTPNTSSPSTATDWLYQVFSYQQPIGFIIYMILIIIFSFFYSFMTINPDKIADNLSKSNAYIPGVRPGDETKDYIAKTLFKVTVLGTIYLALLAALPIITSVIFGFNSSEASAITLGGTSLLIIVGVAMETTQQLESDANKDVYHGLF